MKYALFIRKKGSRDLILENLKDFESSKLIKDDKLDFLGYIKGQGLSYIKDKSGYSIITDETYKLNK